MKLLNVDTIEQVKEKIHNYFSSYKPKTEKVFIRHAVGRYMAQEILSDIDMPQFRRSVVDGFAVVSKDTFGVSESIPVFLDVVGAVEMGQESDIVLKQGQAVYVPTGGMIPEGADAVVMIEHVEKLDDKVIAVYKAASPNNGVMNQGDDFKSGELLYKKGHIITKKDIGMLAAVGCSEITVYKKPIVSIISTGDEIIEITNNPKIGQIRDINSYTIAAFSEDTGAEIGSIEKVKDKKENLIKAVSKAIINSDIVLLSGGSSAGNKDMTAEVIEEMGSPGVITHGVAMKPGKPTIIGVIKTNDKNNGDKSNQNKLVVGLPGHPMAAIIVYKTLVDTFIRKYYFNNEEQPICISASISENLHAGEGRETFQLVTLEDKDVNSSNQVKFIARPIHAKSGSISQLKYADGYIRMSNLCEGVKSGEIVKVMLFY